MTMAMARSATAQQATTTDDGDGATGDEVNDDGDGVMGDGVTGYDDIDDAKLTIMAKV